MSAVEVLAELRAGGVRIVARPGGKLGLRGPANVVVGLRDEVKAHKSELFALLYESSPKIEVTRADGLVALKVSPNTWHPEDRDSESQKEAKMLVRTCKEHGVGLDLEPDGTLVVKSNGKAWRALVTAIEVHIEEVARLITRKWDPHDA